MIWTNDGYIINATQEEECAITQIINYISSTLYLDSIPNKIRNITDSPSFCFYKNKVLMALYRHYIKNSSLQNNNLTFRSATYNVNRDNATNPDFLRNIHLDPIQYGYIEPNYSITLIRIKRNYSYVKNTLDIAFDEEHNWIKSEYIENLQNTLSTFNTFYLKGYLNTLNKSLIIFTNAAPTAISEKILYTALPLAIPEINTEYNQNLYNSFENNPEALINVLLEDAKNFTAERETATLNKFLETSININNTTVSDLKYTIERLNNKANNYIDAYNDTLNQIKDKSMELLGYETKKYELDENLKAFISNNNSLKIIDCDAHFFTAQVTTPVFNYIQSDVEMYYRHARANCITKYPEIAWLFKEIFINRNYNLITNTMIQIPWHGNRYDFHYKGTAAYPNPHIAHHNCFSTTQIAMITAIKKNNLILALNQLIAACGQLTFTDTIVMSELADDLHAYYKDVNCIADKEGNLHSVTELWEAHLAETAETNEEDAQNETNDNI